MPRILIVDDEADLAQLIAFSLGQAGHQTVIVHTGLAALDEARASPVDLVVLDLMLPDLSGTEVCRALKRLRTEPPIAVLMLTARAEEADRVLGFEVGADDYVTKPFSVRELVLRVGAVLRRLSREPAGDRQPLAAGRIRLEPDAHQCFIDEEEVALTALEFRLLAHLLRRRGRVQSREQLLAEVWGAAEGLETRTVDTHMMRLREKLGPARAQLETVRGVGYRLGTP